MAKLFPLALLKLIQTAVTLFRAFVGFLSQGVTIPSQVRYVRYYGRYIQDKLQYRSVPLLLTKITLHGVPTLSNGTCGEF
jgi:hypothetical protein